MSHHKFTNPQIPDDANEGINVRDDHPMRHFLILVTSVIAIAVALTAILAVCAGWLAPRVPFSVEEKLAAPYAARMASSSAVENYLQRVADKLAAAEDLPSDMHIHVHYVEQPIVNAYATLGGNIIVYKGLLEKMPDENTLALVLGHEIAHVRYRHPATALGRSLAIGLVFGVISANAGSSVAGSVLQNAGLLTSLSFTRAQEAQADAAGLQALVKVYGHAGGSGELFDLLQRESKDAEPSPLLATHPLNADRTAHLKELIQQNNWAADGARTLMPEEIRWQLGKLNQNDNAAPDENRPASGTPIDVD